MVPVSGSYATSFALSSGTYSELEEPVVPYIFIALKDNLGRFSGRCSGPGFAQPAHPDACRGGSSVVFQSSWVFTDASLSATIASFTQPKTYTFFVRGVDAAGNDSRGGPGQPATGGVTQSYDFFPPVTGFSAPANNTVLSGGLVPIVGTAVDQLTTVNGVGVAEVRLKAVQIDSLNNLHYWNGSDFLTPGDAPTFNMTSNPTGGWGQVSLTFQNVPAAISELSFADGYHYRIVAQAHDLLNNYDPAYSTTTFLLDRSTPTVTLALPLASNPYVSTNTFAISSGTFLDPSPARPQHLFRPALLNVQVQIQDISVGHVIPGGQSYWTGNGNNWQGAAISSSVPLYQSSWSVVSLPDWVRGDASPDGRQYAIRVYAQDAAGNAGSFPNSAFTKVSTFTFDGTKPVSYVVSPGPNSITPSLATITGTAIDPLINTSSSDVRGVYVSILDNTSTDANYTLAERRSGNVGVGPGSEPGQFRPRDVALNFNANLLGNIDTTLTNLRTTSPAAADFAWATPSRARRS